MPKGELSDEPERIANSLLQNPVKTFEELPLAKTGCDSYSSWHHAFKDFSPVLAVEAIADRIGELLPKKAFSEHSFKRNNSWGDEYCHLVITGGEPLLGWQKSYPALLNILITKYGLRSVTFETNGTQYLKDDFISYLNSTDLIVTMSVSPKLSVSGHTENEALQEDVVAAFYRLDTAFVYTKYVVEKEEDLEEVETFEKNYKKALEGYGRGSLDATYLMPVGGVIDDRQRLTEKQVAEMALKHGYRYSPRMHLNIFGNAWGT
jgi:organic radical activating enzyme